MRIRQDCMWQSSTDVKTEFLDHTQSSAVIPIHDAKHLFANVLRSLQRSDLYEVLVAPRTWELVVTPRIVNSEQRQVVAFRLVKFGFLLIGNSLLVLDDRQLCVKRCCNTTVITGSYKWPQSHSIIFYTSICMCNEQRTHRQQFLARDSMLSSEHAICYRKSVCSSVCLSVTWVDQSKTVEVRIMQFSPSSSPIPLVFAG